MRLHPSFPLLLNVTLLCLCLCLSLLSIPVSSAPSRHVHILTDANFEHDTQASTGSTTGDWLIEFWAPWCGHCRHFEPVFSELAEWARSEHLPITLASLDATQHGSTSKQFNIRSFPSLRIVSHGKVYEYKGSRDLETLKKLLEERSWASASPSSSMPSYPVPPVPTAIDGVLSSMKDVWRDLTSLAQRHPIPAAVLATMGLLFGVVVVMLVYVLFFEPKPIIHNATATRQSQTQTHAKPASVSASASALASASASASSSPALAGNEEASNTPTDSKTKKEQ